MRPRTSQAWANCGDGTAAAHTKVYGSAIVKGTTYVYDTGINFALKGSTRNVPRTSDLLFSVVTDTLPASGNTGPWATYLPSGQTLTPLGSPGVEILNGVKKVSVTPGAADAFYGLGQ